MTGLPLAVLVAAALSAQQDMTQPSRGLQACLSNASSASMFYNRLTPSGKLKFNEMYNAYADMVRKRKGEGWSHGGPLAWGNQGTNWRRSFQQYGIMALFKTADPPTAKAELEREMLRLEQEFETASADRRRVILTRLAVIRAEKNLPRGVCEDWAQETTATVKTMSIGQFDVGWHEIRRGGHAVTFVRHQETGACIAMDPWYRGLPELTGCDEAEDLRASETPSCFAIYAPPS
jgi:hypothetical protein